MAVFKQRRGTAAALSAANETLAAGQLCIETDTNRMKVGDGSTPYNALPYLRASSLIIDVAGLQTALAGKASTAHAATHESGGSDPLTIQASQVSGLTSAIVAAAPPTTDASLLTSGVLSASRLPASGATPGTYTSVTVDTYGRVTSGSSPAVAYSSLTGVPSTFTPPVATASVRGGVKQGSNVTISADGTISVAAPVTSLAWTAITGKPTFATVATSGAYADLSGVPSTLPPTAGSVTDASITSSGLSPASVAWVAIQDWAAYVSYAKGDLVSFNGTAWRATSAHTSAFAFDLSKWAQMTPSSFDASQITSGTVSANRLPSATTSTAGIVTVGTGLSVSSGTVSVTYGSTSTTASVGNHTHAQLHDRSHAMTSASDHTATAWRLFYSNGSGVVTELSFGSSGQALISNGASAVPSWGQAGSNSASDLTTGTLSDQRLSTAAQAAINLYLWSSFR